MEVQWLLCDYSTVNELAAKMPLWAGGWRSQPKTEGLQRAYSVEKLGNIVFRFFCQSHFIFDVVIKTIMRADTANYKRA